MSIKQIGKKLINIAIEEKKQEIIGTIFLTTITLATIGIIIYTKSKK